MGSNALRILWRHAPKFDLPGMDMNKLEQIIQEAIKWKMVPIVELHDATGILELV